MNPAQKLIEFDRESPKKIMVVGDALTDVWIKGDPGSCQDSCLCLREERSISAPGGARNAVRQLEHWQSKTLDYSFPRRNIPNKIRFLDAHDRIVFRHDTPPWAGDFTEMRRETLSALTTGLVADAVLLSDYHKGFLTQEFVAAIIDHCNEQDISCVADAHVARPPHFYAGAVLKGNGAYTQTHPYILEESGRAVFTFGDNYPVIVGEQAETLEPPLSPVVCRNHVGAGDCFAAHLTLALAHGLSLSEAVAVAHAAGRVYVQHLYGRSPYPHEIHKDLDPVGGKVLSPVDLTALRQSISGRIVFTNGVFRLPHAGHAWFLDWTRQQGDCLVVGINDDASAARLRLGQTIIPLQERMGLLAGLTAVDWIVPFSEDDPCEIIQLLEPDLLVKGDEYKSMAVPGADLVSKVVFAPAGPFPCHASELIKQFRTRDWPN